MDDVNFQIKSRRRSETPQKNPYNTLRRKRRGAAERLKREKIKEASRERESSTGRNTDLFKQHPHLVAISGIATTDLCCTSAMQWSGRHRELKPERPAEFHQDSPLPSKYQLGQSLDFYMPQFPHVIGPTYLTEYCEEETRHLQKQQIPEITTSQLKTTMTTNVCICFLNWPMKQSISNSHSF